MIPILGGRQRGCGFERRLFRKKILTKFKCHTERGADAARVGSTPTADGEYSVQVYTDLLVL
jgi:hypothetical protein